MNEYDKKHLHNLTAIERAIQRIFMKAAEDAARIGMRLDTKVGDKPFSFASYPSVKPAVEKLMRQLKEQLEVAVVDGVKSAWTLANNKNDALSRRVFGDNVGKLTPAQYRRYFSTNAQALEAFLARKTEGLSLSDRVWNYTNAFREQIELGLEVGIRSGTASAGQMAEELKQWLVHPDKLFRRVRDAEGLLQLSSRAKAFHPGRGVYRSSYMNARRLAATETNTAYRTADHLRWQQMDFVVGIEICLSNNHTVRLQPGETTDDPTQLRKDGTPKAGAVRPLHDICDELKGRYPKSFKFTGWHPHCRCYAVTILKTDEELDRDTERILDGKEPMEGSANEVKDVPEGFRKWLKRNVSRAERSTSVPYFISDNEKYLPNGYKNLYALKTPYETYAEYVSAMKYNKKYADFTPEVLKNNRDLDQVLPVMQGKIMTFTEADRGHSNPHFTDVNAKAAGYHDNCQTCTMAYELRRRGFPVEAVPNPIADGYKKMRDFTQFCARNGIEWNDRYLTADGKSTDYAWSHCLTEDTVTAKNAFIEAQTAVHGRYEVYCAWKTGNAHVFIVERQKNGELLWFDPQTARRGKSFNDSLALMIKEQIGVLRIDDKIINPKFASRLLKASR